MSDIVEQARAVAKNAADAGINGWGNIVSDLTAEIERLRAEVTKLEDEQEASRDIEANWQADMLCKFDSAAADSTDLYTWISCMLAEKERLRSEVARLRTRLEWREDGHDGIYCRDETIRMLEDKIARLREDIVAMHRAEKSDEA